MEGVYECFGLIFPLDFSWVPSMKTYKVQHAKLARSHKTKFWQGNKKPLLTRITAKLLSTYQGLKPKEKFFAKWKKLWVVNRLLTQWSIVWRPRREQCYIWQPFGKQMARRFAIGWPSWSACDQSYRVSKYLRPDLTSVKPKIAANKDKNSTKDKLSTCFLLNMETMERLLRLIFNRKCV